MPNRTLDGTHRRHNPLLDSWVLVSAGRDRRPWQGSIEAAPVARRPAYEPSCYLCPGNERAGGVRNPDYQGTYVFTNDFPALSPDVAEAEVRDGLLLARTEAGTCNVLCYSPRHDLDLVDLDDASLEGVIEAWAAQTNELGRRYPWVQVFENRGEAMGASSPHPHGQIWAGSVLPADPAREQASQALHHERTGRSLLLDYVAQEANGPRIVARNAEWTALVPFWAVWPFETLLIANAPVGRLGDLSEAARAGLASDPARAVGSLRRPLSGAVSVLVRVAPGSVRSRRRAGRGRDGRSTRLATACALLPADAPLGDDPQVHGRIRASGRAAARSHARSGGRAPASSRHRPIARDLTLVDLAGEFADQVTDLRSPVDGGEMTGARDLGDAGPPCRARGLPSR